MNHLGYLTRSIRWSPFGIAGTVATGIVIAQRNASAAKPIQAVSIMLASAVGFAFDDTAADILDASPTALFHRRFARLGCTLVPVVGLWIALVGLQGPASTHEGIALTAMFAGLLGLSLGVAGIASRRMTPGRGGIAVGPTLLVLLIVSTTMPPRWRPLPLGDIPGGWAAINMRWTTAAIAGSVLFIWSSRDRADRHARSRERKAP
jgi:hypothetical protein